MPAIDFDVTAYEAQPVRSGWDPLPPGDYTACVTSTEVKPTKAGNGEYIELTIEIMDGDFSGRKIWERLNINNPSEQTVQIARSQLNQLATALGQVPLKDTDQLLEIPFTLTLDIDRKDTTRNRVMGYSSASSAPRKSSTNAATPGYPSAGGGGGSATATGTTKKPWEK
jgi:hypothetical protein